MRRRKCYERQAGPDRHQSDCEASDTPDNEESLLWPHIRSHSFLPGVGTTCSVACLRKCHLRRQDASYIRTSVRRFELDTLRRVYETSHVTEPIPLVSERSRGDIGTNGVRGSESWWSASGEIGCVRSSSWRAGDRADLLTLSPTGRRCAKKAEWGTDQELAPRIHATAFRAMTSR